MKFTFFSFLTFIVILSSCSSPKHLIYLQDEQADAKTEQLIKTVQLQESQYKIKPGDRLQLNIFSLTDEKINFLKEPQVEVDVDNKGQIEVPVVGFVDINGLTIREAEAKIKKASADYLRSPSVSIKLMNFNFTVIGEVQNQGGFTTPDGRVNILEAVGRAGGLTENANRQNIRLVRSENNTAKIYRINLLEDNTLMSKNYFLQPNDIIIVDPVKATGTRQERTATIGLVISVISSVSFLLYQLFRE